MRTTFKNELIKKGGAIFVFVLTTFGPSFLFSEQVDTAWVRHYNGTGNSGDYPKEMTMDSKGNIYITGASVGVGTDIDIITLKYDSSGNLLWERRYSGPGNGGDEGRDIVVDKNGNVYVTGPSAGVGVLPQWYDGITIKYDSSGNQLWAVRFNGASNDHDELFFVGVDTNENIYVTGVTYVVNPPFSSFYPIILKYSSNGNYLGGQVLSSGSGTLITVLPEGGFYLGGNGSTVAKFNPSLTMLWSKPAYSGSALLLDDKRNIYTIATRVPGHDYAVSKLDSGGNQFWSKFYNGPSNGADVPRDLAITRDSRFAFVTGYSQGGGTGYDFATIKYDSSGNELWIRRFNGADNRNDRAAALAVDSRSNIYVTGSANGGSDFYNVDSADYLTIKYDSLGNEIWRQYYNTPFYGSDVAVDIAIDLNSDVYVTGSSYNEVNGLDIVTIKYIQFLKGDLDGDGSLGLADVVLQLNCVFLGEGNCPSRIADMNCDGSMSAADVVILLLVIYASFPPPC